MPLAAVMDSLEGVDQAIADLYTEKNGKFELTGITGIKTAADVQRVTQALENEKTNHAETKQKLGVWGDMSHEETMAALDSIPALKAQAEGKFDENKMNEEIERRVAATVKTQTAPLERQVTTLQTQNKELTTANEAFVAKDNRRAVHDAVGAVLVENKVIDHARDDALLQAERLFKVTKDETTGETIIASDDGITPKDWILDIQAKGTKPHWWGPTSGGGAGPGGRQNTGENPWSKDSWNFTKQGQILREKGAEHADRLAKAAGHKKAAGAMKRDAK